MKHTAAVLRQAEAERTALAQPDVSGVEALRRRLSGSTAREHVVLDFLEDDLREARTALAGVAAYLANVEAALGDEQPTPDRLLALARAIDPAARVDHLQNVLASVRHRLSQVSARM